LDGANQIKKRKRSNVARYTGNLTGDVYELVVDNVQKVIKSGQIQGTIRLTDTHFINYAPFIIILITKQLSDRFTTQRPPLIS
jgi:hypothetical protein